MGNKMNIQEKIAKVAKLRYNEKLDDSFVIEHTKVNNDGVDFYKYVCKFSFPTGEGLWHGMYVIHADLFDKWDGSEETWKDYHKLEGCELDINDSNFGTGTVRRGFIDCKSEQ